jgi:hypothetical protein
MHTNEDETETEAEECVRVVGNEIFFYGTIDRDNTLEFVENFKKLEIELLKKKS